tara:strand:+ start:3706 stop:4926 length:1221 start_codon:yes stop_codon:yes gene_type:complete
MVDENMVEKVAKNVGCSAKDLMDRQASVLRQQGETLRNAGKTEEEVGLMCLRVAAQQIRSAETRLKRSGCTLFEGVFVSVPRYKNWAKFAYDKAKNTLNSLSPENRMSLVSSGQVILFEKDGAGWMRHSNPSLDAQSDFVAGSISSPTSKLPEEGMALSDGSMFVCVWNNSMPVFANGNVNFRYGKARPQEELDRTSLFFGRKAKTEDDFAFYNFKAQGDMAKLNNPTFTPCSIPAVLGKDEKTLYAKKGVSTVTEDPSVIERMADDPLAIVASAGDRIAMLEGLSDIVGFMATKDEKTKWDAVGAIVLEVIHIDPRERGGYVVTVGDLDLTSPEPPIDLYVPKGHEHRVTFGVGSRLLVVGNTWVGREQGDGRLSPTGWFCVEELGSAEGLETLDLDEDTESDWE